MAESQSPSPASAPESEHQTLVLSDPPPEKHHALLYALCVLAVTLVTGGLVYGYWQFSSPVAEISEDAGLEVATTTSDGGWTLITKDFLLDISPFSERTLQFTVQSNINYLYDNELEGGVVHTNFSTTSGKVYFKTWAGADHELFALSKFIESESIDENIYRLAFASTPMNDEVEFKEICKVVSGEREGVTYYYLDDTNEILNDDALYASLKNEYVRYADIMWGCGYGMFRIVDSLLVVNYHTLQENIAPHLAPGSLKLVNQ